MRLFRIFDVAIKLGVRVHLIGYPDEIPTLAGVLIGPSCYRLGPRIAIVPSLKIATYRRAAYVNHSEIWRGATRITRDNRITHVNPATRYIPEHVQRHIARDIRQRTDGYKLLRDYHCRVNLLIHTCVLISLYNMKSERA